MKFQLIHKSNFKGVLENSGAPSSNTNVYMALYDGFEPPRILEVITIELDDVEPTVRFHLMSIEKLMQGQ